MRKSTAAIRRMWQDQPGACHRGRGMIAAVFVVEGLVLLVNWVINSGCGPAVCSIGQL